MNHLRAAALLRFQTRAPVLRDVGEVQRGRRREDVVEVLGSGFLEAVQGGAGEVPRQRLLLLARSSARQLHHRMFGQHHADRVTMETLAVQMTHRCRGEKFAVVGKRRRKSVDEKPTAKANVESAFVSDQVEPESRRSSGPERFPSC